VARDLETLTLNVVSGYCKFTFAPDGTAMIASDGNAINYWPGWR
jgi:hypothetical protein